MPNVFYQSVNLQVFWLPPHITAPLAAVTILALGSSSPPVLSEHDAPMGETACGFFCCICVTE